MKLDQQRRAKMHYNIVLESIEKDELIQSQRELIQADEAVINKLERLIGM